MITRHPTRARLWRRAAALAVCGLVVMSSALSVSAAPAASGDDSMTLTADRVEYDSPTRRVRADGHARAAGRGAVITADHLEADLGAQEIVARGNVTLAQGDKTLTASVLRYNLTTRTGHVEQAAGQLNVWHVTAETVDVAPAQDVATGASITPCDPEHPAYKVTAKKIEIAPGRFTAYDATLWVAGVHVVTVPVYTASTSDKRNGPSLGYDSLDGVFIEYANSFLVGGWRDEYRFRLATTTGFSAENIISQRFGAWTVSSDLGRSRVKDQSGNNLNIDRYSIDVASARLRIPGWPATFLLEAHGGSYGELATGVVTTRAEAIATFATDTFQLSPSVYFSASGRLHGDVYGTGQSRLVIEGSAALSTTLSPRASASLSYDLIDVKGTTPFTFDAYSVTSSTTLNFNYVFGGFLQSAGASVTYGFLAMQTTVGLNASFNVTPNMVFNVAGYYNVTTQQLTEVDYALNVRCDCVTVGLVYQTFPQSPGSNALMVTVNLTTLGQGVTFSGSGVKSQ